MISEVIVNHEERNYFNDYSEIRSDHMCGVEDDKVIKAIDKLVRRYKDKYNPRRDCMFVINEDGSGWRLMFDHDRDLLEKGVEQRFLRLRHFTNVSISSWDTEETVSVAYAKQAILGRE